MYVDGPAVGEIQSIMDQQKEIIEKDGIHRSPRILLIFDDCITDKQVNNNQGTFIQIFTMGRHLNFSVWITAQSYMKIPKTCRLQLTNLFIFSPSEKEIAVIAGENVSPVISIQDLSSLIRISTLRRYDFFNINKQCPDIKQMYRKNLEEIYEIYEMDEE